MLELNRIYNMDCKIGMKEIPDKYFELAIVDPPYGISQPAFRRTAKNKAAKCKNYNNAVYKQDPPDEQYFVELNRISKNQIIWGANYYNQFLVNGKQWVFWDKGTEKTQWGDGELAYTSFDGAIKKYTFIWNGMLQQDMANKEIRIHPTQKPVALYKWILKNYAKPGDKIIDTHMGSGSSVIACYDMGFDYMAFEIDKDYFEAANKRIEDHKAQTRMVL